jgi:hypothetical protein
VTQDETCTACNGAGWVSSPTTCSVCHGSGSSDSWATRLPPAARERIDMTPCTHFARPGMQREAPRRRLTRWAQNGYRSITLVVTRS